MDDLRRWLAAGDFASIREAAAESKRILGLLTALTYDADSLIGWRAVEAIGVAADRVAERDPEFARGHLRRLIWLMKDEAGGIVPHAPEIVGEILRHRPGMLADFIPILVSLLEIDEEDAVRFRAGTLWAIGRLGSAGVRVAVGADLLARGCLADPDPQVRGLAVWCLGRIGAGQIVGEQGSLLDDLGSVEVYEDGELTRSSVAQLAREALKGG